MKAADKIVPLLERVRQTGSAEWVARCPAHDDRSPSLAVRETDDGRLLLHCFAGCDTGSVLRALGLELADLFDAPLEHYKARIRHPFSPAAVLKAIRGEALIVALGGNDALSGKLSKIDSERVSRAVARIWEAVEYA